jgi:hypothetical protein
MKTSRPTPRKLRPSARADEPIGDREHAFVDGVRVCLPCNPKGNWYWVLDGELTPTGQFRTERDADTAALHRNRLRLP